MTCKGTEILNFVILQQRNFRTPCSHNIKRKFFPSTHLFVIRTSRNYRITAKKAIKLRNRHSISHIPSPRPLYGATAPMGQGPLINKASRSHADTLQSVGVLWTSDQPDLITHNTQKRQTSMPTARRDKHPCPRRDSNPQYQQARGQGATP
jgi:hypothetical protein